MLSVGQEAISEWESAKKNEQNQMVIDEGRREQEGGDRCCGIKEGKKEGGRGNTESRKSKRQGLSVFASGVELWSGVAIFWLSRAEFLCCPKS